MKKSIVGKAAAAAASLALVSGSAMAAAPAWVSDITSGVDDAKTAIESIIAALAAIVVVRLIWNKVRSAAR